MQTVLLLLFLLGASLALIPMNILTNRKPEVHVKKDGPCDPNLLYDATIVYAADIIASEFALEVPIEDDIFEVVMPRCARKFKNFFGVETEDFWKGTGPPPKGWTGYNATSMVYRLYGIATPEYKNHFPLTNGRVYDDAFVLFSTMQLELGGEYRKMMHEMGMTAVIPTGSNLYCGQYRLFENDTNGMYQLAPPIRYFGEMPMMPMFTAPDMNLVNSITMINCALESDWWGPGLSTGVTVFTTNTTTGILTTYIRNTLVFPPSILDRQYPPRYNSCEPLPSNH